MSLFGNKPPLGTPGNPEILDPGEMPREHVVSPPPFARVGMIFQILKTMLWTALPALFIDWIAFGLFDVARHPDGLWAWLALVFVAPPAFFLTLFAVVVNGVMSLLLLFTLFGRALPRPMSQSQFIRFVHRPRR